MSKKEKAQIGVVLCSIFLIVISIIGNTYAYFTSTILGNDTAKDTVITTGTMKIEYTNTQEIRGEALLPGWQSEAKTFTVRNTGTLPVNYDIKLTNITNTFAKPEELVFKLTKDGETVIEEQAFPIEETTISSNITIEPEQTHTYTMQVIFKELGIAQDYNQEKEFTGKVEIVESTGENAVAKLTNLAKTNTTEMFTDDTADANIRYMGADPANYVDIGNGNDENGNPILWRVIGVMNNVDDGTGKKETRLKVIRDKHIGKYSFSNECSDTDIDENNNCSYDKLLANNNYVTSDLNNLLNNGYYNKIMTTSYNIAEYVNGNYLVSKINSDFRNIGISEESKILIGDAIYYLGGPFTDAENGTEYESWTVNDYYSGERGANAYNNHPTTWIGKIGLMYPSDYGYATSGGKETSKQQCSTMSLLYWNYNGDEYIDCFNNDWLLKKDMSQMTMTPSRSNASGRIGIERFGNVSYTDGKGSVSPVLYLKSDVKIVSGNGTKSNPYKLGI